MVHAEQEWLSTGKCITVFVEHAMQSPSVTCSVTARSPFKEGNIQSIYKYWKDTCCLQMSESLSVELEVMHKHVQ